MSAFDGNVVILMKELTIEDLKLVHSPLFLFSLDYGCDKRATKDTWRVIKRKFKLGLLSIINQHTDSTLDYKMFVSAVEIKDWGYLCVI